MRKWRSSSAWLSQRDLMSAQLVGLELGEKPGARLAQLGLATDLVEVEEQLGVGVRGLAHGVGLGWGALGSGAL